jgi:hypothetical protein
MASPKMSRPQPYSTVIGTWNSPAEARGPKPIRAIRQPARTTSSGGTRAGLDEADIDGLRPERVARVAHAPRRHQRVVVILAITGMHSTIPGFTAGESRNRDRNFHSIVITGLVPVIPMREARPLY